MMYIHMYDIYICMCVHIYIYIYILMFVVRFMNLLVYGVVVSRSSPCSNIHSFFLDIDEIELEFPNTRMRDDT